MIFILIFSFISSLFIFRFANFIDKKFDIRATYQGEKKILGKKFLVFFIILTSLYFCLAFNKWGFDYNLLIFSFLFYSILGIIFITDLLSYWVPDFLLLPLAILGVIYNIYLDKDIIFVFIEILLMALFFISIYYFLKNKIGSGDLKLLLALKLFYNWQELFLVFFLSCLLGSILVFVFSQIKHEKVREIPFVPFIFFSSLLCNLFGDEILNYYWAYIL